MKWSKGLRTEIILSIRHCGQSKAISFYGNISFFMRCSVTSQQKLLFIFCNDVEYNDKNNRMIKAPDSYRERRNRRSIEAISLVP
jgi:hypothetical protein